METSIKHIKVVSFIYCNPKNFDKLYHSRNQNQECIQPGQTLLDLRIFYMPNTASAFSQKQKPTWALLLVLRKFSARISAFTYWAVISDNQLDSSDAFVFCHLPVKREQRAVSKMKTYNLTQDKMRRCIRISRLSKKVVMRSTRSNVYSIIETAFLLKNLLIMD